MKSLNDSPCRAECIYLDYNASTPVDPAVAIDSVQNRELRKFQAFCDAERSKWSQRETLCRPEAIGAHLLTPARQWLEELD